MCVEADGAGRHQPVNQPILSLEERVMVALSARGERSIAVFIALALIRVDTPRVGDFTRQPYFLSDEDFVRALEAEVFGK